MWDTETEPAHAPTWQPTHAKGHAAAGEFRRPTRFPAPMDEDDELEPTIVRGRE